MAVPFYRYSYKTAESEGNVAQYRASNEENRKCRDYVQDENTGFYANAYKGNSVDGDRKYTQNLIKEFGMERVLNMYAVTVKSHRGDGRISKSVKDWAENFNCGLRENEDMQEYMLTNMAV